VCHNSNFEDTNLALGVITALPAESLHLLVCKPHVFSACIDMKNRRYENKDTTVVRSGYEWKTADTSTPQSAEPQLARSSYMLHALNCEVNSMKGE
jgi:hypothetical protein